MVKGNFPKWQHRADMQIKRILVQKPSSSLFSSRFAPASNNQPFFLRNALWDLTHDSTSGVRLLIFNHLVGKQRTACISKLGFGSKAKPNPSSKLHLPTERVPYLIGGFLLRWGGVTFK